MLSDREDGIAARVGVAVKEVRRLEDDLARAFTELMSASDKAAGLDMHFTPRFGAPVEAALKAWKAERRDTGGTLEVGRVWGLDETVEAPVGEERAA